MPKNNISMFNFKLVEAVEQHPCLYDYNLRDYSNRELTNAVWESIAAQLQADVQECKNTWKNLRIVFTRYLRNQESDTSKKRKEYYLNTRMMFLCPFVRPKSSSSLSTSFHVKAEPKVEVQQQQQQLQQQQQHRYQMKQEPTLEVPNDSYNAIYNGSGSGCGADHAECDDDDGDGDGDDDDEDMYTEWPPIECKIDCSDTDEAAVVEAANEQNEQQQQQQQYKSEHAYNVDKNNDKYMMTITINNNNNVNRNGHHDDDVKYLVGGDEEEDEGGNDPDTDVNNEGADEDEDDPPEMIEAQKFECHMSEESSSEMPPLYNNQSVNQTTSENRNHNQKLPHLQYIRQQQQPIHDHHHYQPSLTNCVNSHRQQVQKQQPQRHSARLNNHSNSGIGTTAATGTAHAASTTELTAAVATVATAATLAAANSSRSSKRQRRAESSPSSSSERISDELTSDFISNYSNLLVHSSQNKHYRKWYLISLIRDLDDMSDAQFREFRRRTDSVIDDIMRPAAKKLKP